MKMRNEKRRAMLGSPFLFRNYRSFYWIINFLLTTDPPDWTVIIHAPAPSLPSETIWLWLPAVTVPVKSVNAGGPVGPIIEALIVTSASAVNVIGIVISLPT